MRFFPILIFFLLVIGGGLYYLNQGLLSQDVPYQTATAAKSNPSVVVTSPLSNALITSPLNISGKARGNWYFEASFPIVLEDQAGKVLAQTQAEAQGEWMTTAYVPFTATLIFDKPAAAAGRLVFKKDNPSGLPQNDASFKVPVRFK